MPTVIVLKPPKGTTLRRQNHSRENQELYNKFFLKNVIGERLGILESYLMQNFKNNC
jgi:hypothetical protein